MPTGTGVRRAAARRVPDETALGQEDRDASMMWACHPATALMASWAIRPTQ